MFDFRGSRIKPSLGGSFQKMSYTVCVEDGGINKKAEISCSCSSSVHLPLLYCGVSSAPRPKKTHSRPFLYQELRILVCPFHLEKLCLWCYCQEEAASDWGRFGWAGTIFFFFHFLKYWMKLNRSKHVCRRKNRGTYLLWKCQERMSQKKNYGHFFSRKNAFKLNLVCFFNDNSFPFSTKLLALG